MTSRIIKHAIWLTLAAGATALAAGGPPPGKGGGNKPPTEATNNLSVPAIMAGGVGTFSIDCKANVWSTLTLPDKAPKYYPPDCATGKDGVQKCVAEGYYYVQRDAKWQAPCTVVDSVSAVGAWGDNLSGSATLKVGSPIRVELVLWDYQVATGQKGYYVIKLEPRELDRLSDYGHLADGELVGPWSAHPYTVGESLPDGSTFGAIVHDTSATLKIELLDDGVPVSPPVYNGAAGGEINATGKIVYGYNLSVGAAGTYRLTYHLPKVQLLGCVEAQAVCEGNDAVLDINVTAGGGKKGGRQ